jgi:hypothetical protein
VVNYRGGAPVQAVVIAATDEGAHFVANATDPGTVTAMLGPVRAGQPILVTPGEKGALHFSLV